MKLLMGFILCVVAFRLFAVDVTTYQHNVIITAPSNESTMCYQTCNNVGDIQNCYTVCN